MFTTLAGEALAAAALAAGGCAYAAMWPGSRIFGQALIAPRRPGELALTFDDGPNPAWTPQLLDILAEHGVKATFFFVGKYVLAEPALTRSVLDAGHLLGNHTWSHPNLALCSAARIKDELSRTQEILQQTTGKPVRYFRPPFGARRPSVLRIARELGMTPVLWNAMTSDWKQPDGQAIAAQLAAKVDTLQQKGWAANIVLHDGGHTQLGANRGPSIGAARQLLARFSSTHRFVSLEAWSEPAGNIRV